jgi:kynurenine formamidase
MTHRLIDLSVPIRPPQPGEVTGGTGLAASLAAEIEYITHEDSVPTFTERFGCRREDLPDGKGFAGEQLRLTGHAGTHVDAPWHYFPTTDGARAKTVDELPLEHFFAPGVVLDLRRFGPGERVGTEDVQEAVRATGGPVAPGDIVCCMFGQDRHFGTARYWDDYAGLGAEAVRWLVGEGVKVIGTDAPGLDRGFSYMARDFQATGDRSLIWEAHRVGMEFEYFQIEKLANLDRLPPRGFTVACFPISIEGGSGAWCRAVALLPA